MAGRRIQFSIVGDTSRLRKAVDGADRRLSKFRGTALKAAAGIIALNSAMTLGHAAVVLFAGILAALPVALAGIGIAGAAMDKRVQTAFGNLKTRALDTVKSIGKPLIDPLVDGAASLGRALDSVAPYLTQISAAAAPLVRGFFARVESFADKVGPKLPAMFANALPVLKGFASLIGQIGAAIGRFFSGDLLNGNKLGAAFTAAGATIAGFLDRLRAIGDILAPFVEQIAAGLKPVIDAVVGALDVLLQKLEPVSDWFAKNPSIIQAVATAIGIVVVALTAFSVVMSIVNAVMLLSPFTWIVIGIVALIAVIILCVKHWDKIKAAMSRLWSWVSGVFVAGWDWAKKKLLQVLTALVSGHVRAWQLVFTKLGQAVGWFRALPGRITGAIGRFGALLVSRGRDLIAGLSSGITNRWSALRSWINGIKDRAKSALGNTARTLYSAGRDLLAGMISGVQAMAGRLVSAVTGPIGDAVGKAKSLLGISSPSKVFAEIGRFVMQGYTDGVDSYARKARTAVEGAVDPSNMSISAAAGGAGGGITIQVTVQGIVGDPVATGRQIAGVIGAYVGAGGRVRTA